MRNSRLLRDQYQARFISIILCYRLRVEAKNATKRKHQKKINRAVSNINSSKLNKTIEYDIVKRFKMK